jgi:CPA2 family monovalent cation:H+ antiporter-2
VELTLLSSIVVIFGLSVVVIYLFNLLRIPAVVGFILTGLLVGPHGLSLISAVDQVEVLAEIGIILLLFTIGLEFSFRNLWKIRQSVLAGGSLQVAITAALATVLCVAFSLPLRESILIGFLVALSSTAIVLKLLQERGEVDTPHGNMTLAILIFQDLIAIPMMLALPFLAGIGTLEGGSLLAMLFWDILILAFLVACAKWFVPYFLFQIARTRNRELFLLFVVLTCIGVAWLTSLAGLSLALGALLAGLIISESEYSGQAIGNVIPFRDVFTSFFFVSVGMLLDIHFLASHGELVFLLVVLVIVLKAVIAGGVPAVLGYPIRTMVLVGLGLGQVGEFSFILSQSGLEFGLLSPEAYQIFIAVALVTMAATPFLLSGGPRVADAVSRLPLPDRLRTGRISGAIRQPPPLHDHLVIVGYGVNGRNLSRAARVGGIPYVILEMNPETVRTERAKGEPITYGDATNEAVLQHASLERARILVVVINDPTSSRRITELARRINPNLYIIVRTRYIQEMGPLYRLGADEVIPEEFETSVEIFTRVLKKYLVSRGTIDRFIAEVRADNYQMLRSLPRTSATLSDLIIDIPDIEISTFRVVSDAPVCGKTLGEMALRKRHGVTVVAIERGGQILANPGAEATLEAQDRAIVLGTAEKIAEAAPLFLAQGEKRDVH